MTARPAEPIVETVAKVVGVEVGEGDVVCQLDPTPHPSKPDEREIAAITRRLQGSGPVIVSEEEFIGAVMQGATWCGGCFGPSKAGWGPFWCEQLFALDLDNDAGNHTPLEPGQPGYLDPVGALQRCKDLGLEPMMLYFTFSSSTEPWWPRYRLVFRTDEPVCDEVKARSVIGTLLRAFPEADQKCSNVNRLFFGGVEYVDCRHGGWRE